MQGIELLSYAKSMLGMLFLAAAFLSARKGSSRRRPFAVAAAILLAATIVAAALEWSGRRVWWDTNARWAFAALQYFFLAVLASIGAAVASERRWS